MSYAVDTSNRREPRSRSNRLPMLAATINAAHAAAKRHIKATIDEMMTAGDALREAKGLVGHGKWLVWLRSNCPHVSERTAHLYMQLAKWRSVIEEAMSKSAMIADLERDQLRIPDGLAVGPFGVVDAIAAIRAAEQHERAVKENRLKLAAGPPGPIPDHLKVIPADPLSMRSFTPADPRCLLEDFANHLKCSLSRIGVDQEQRAEFLRRARGVLEAMQLKLDDDARADAGFPCLHACGGAVSGPLDNNRKQR